MTWSGALANTSRSNATPLDDVRHVRRRRGEVEIAAIVFDGRNLRKRERQIAERLVRHLRQRFRHDLLAHEAGRFAILAGRGQEASDLWKRLSRIRVHRIVRPPCPQRVFVELQPLVNDAAETPSRRAFRCRPAVRAPTPRPAPGPVERGGSKRMVRRRSSIPEAEWRRPAAVPLPSAAALVALASPAARRGRRASRRRDTRSRGVVAGVVR